MNGSSAYCEQDWLGEKFENIKTAPRLIVPFKARSALQTVANSRNWKAESYFSHHQFDPENNFRGVILSDGKTDFRETDPFIFNNLEAFQNAIASSTSKSQDSKK